MQINDNLLEQFITTFYGSGNYSGDYWFVGMEEGGGNTLERVEKRLNTWQKLGGNELVDLYDFHIGINYPDYFRDPVKPQRTWMQQARIILASKGRTSSLEEVKAYQRDYLGRRTKETCLLELLPLPSPNTNIWNYNKWSVLPYLQNRKSYKEYCLPWRSEHIYIQIRTHHPKLVVFFGKSYYSYWRQIAGSQVTFRDESGFLTGNSDNTIFIICKHPAAKGVTNAYYEEIGITCRNIFIYK